MARPAFSRSALVALVGAAIVAASLTLSGSLTVGGNATLGDTEADGHTAWGTLTSKETVGAAVGGANINIDLIDTTPAAAGVGGSLRFQGVYTGTSTTTGAEIKAYKTNGTAGNFGFDLVFATRPDGGSVTERMRISDQGAVAIPGALTINGTSTLGDAVGDTTTISGSCVIGGNAYIAGNIELSQAGDTYIYGSTSTSSGNQNLNLFAGGTGEVRVNSNTGGVSNAGTGGLGVYGGAGGATRQVWLKANGDIVANGAAQLGDGTTDTVTAWGHVKSQGAAPTLSSCGASPTITGTDYAGIVTTGAAATGCTITFSRTMTNEPACVITPKGSATNPTCTESATAITCSAAAASTKYKYVCVEL